MALRGKRKPGSRGSQGRRRPATAPRPAPTTARGLPWYHRNGGRLVIAIGIALAVGGIWWAISTTQSNADRLEARQDALDEYTGTIRSVGQAVSEPIGEMTAVPPAPDDAALEDLAGSSGRWAKSITEAQTSLVETFPAGATLQRANGMFQQALQLYDSAARTYQLVGRAQPSLQPDLLARAAAQRDQAAALWSAAVAMIDAARGSAELEASGIPVPGAEAATQPALPTDLPTEATSPAPDATEGGG